MLESDVDFMVVAAAVDLLRGEHLNTDRLWTIIMNFNKGSIYFTGDRFNIFDSFTLATTSVLRCTY